MKTVIVRNALLFFFLFPHASIFAQTPQQLQNALAFSRLYGYIKYFHPSDEAASIDWNRFAIYGSGRVSLCKNSKELMEVLDTIFKPIAPSLQLFQVNGNARVNDPVLLSAKKKEYKTIAWQHIGVGTGMAHQNNVYRSARTNRSTVTPSTAPAFAPAFSFLNAQSLQGKAFVFKGRMRLMKGDGQGQLWVRVDKTNGATGFFDNMNDRPVKSKEWATYEINGTIDTNARSIYFGIMLGDKGVLQFDDLSFTVKDGDVWKELYTNSFTESDKGDSSKNLTFKAFPYYRIAIENESSQGIASISSMEKELLNESHDTLFQQHPHVGEYIEKSIGAGITAIIPLALYGTPKQTFPVADTAGLRRLKEALINIPSSDISGNNLYTRLGDLAITWNVFQHFYPYFDVIKTDWNAALEKAVERAYTDKTDIDFHKTLQLMTAQLKDGHVYVNALFSKAFFMPAISWEWLEGQLVITYVSDTSLSIKRGDIVTEINDKTAKHYFSGIDSTISAATTGWLQYKAKTGSLMGEKGSAIKLKILHADNKTDTVTITRETSISQYNAALPKQDSIKLFPNDMTYINIGMASMSTIEKMLPVLKKSKVIICDLRGYPNNNSNFIKYLLHQKDTSRQWMQIPLVIYPDRERIAGWKKMGWELQPTGDRLNAKILFLIDGRAISYAESYMGFIEHYKLATIIGQPTAGTNGNINPFTLPGGYYISWTGMKVLKHDGTTHHGVGIQPNILVNKTIKGVREGRDEFLEKAIEIGSK